VAELDYIAAIRRDSEALADAAEDHLHLRVPACPDWSVADLVWHTGEVHHFWASVAEGLLQDRDGVSPVSRPPDPDLISWFRQKSRFLADVLERTDPSTSVWTWAAQKNVAFIRRRMAHETAVHRWDAQAASGATTAIGPQLAVDGIDEFLDVHMTEGGDFREGKETVHLHCTDAPGEWVARIAEGRLDVSKEHAKGDVAVRGMASDILLLLWRRIQPGDVDVVGDEVTLKRFLGRTDLT
jgi:uncharacterized protein (TIGR03083 family)